MRIAVETPLKGFQNDIADVIRLFFGEGSAVEPGENADAQLIHEHEETEGRWRERFVLYIEGRECEAQREGECVPEGLEGKRRLKRLIKQTCYDLLKTYTGRKPAWGSLTGIRPTRLYYQLMDRGFSAEETEQKLMETFDISQEKIGLLSEIVRTQRPLLQENGKTCDLYIGIPFCVTRCSYCSFSSGEIGDGHLVEPYLSALFHEMKETAALIRHLGYQVSAAYIGGGTPTSLSTPQLHRLLSYVEECFGHFKEWTLEAGRPDTLDREKLQMIRSHPVSRISINPQTMNDETLNLIGRKHSAEDIVRAYQMARDVGFDDINMDIIAALPGENLEMFRRTLSWIRKLKPESLTVHTLAIKRSSALHEQRYIQDAKVAGEMVREARACAKELGMSAYYLYRQKYMADNLENVGYAVPGRACRYNIDNMEETTSVFAMGAGAISKYVQKREEKIVRAPNISNIGQYIQRVEEMCRRKETAFSLTKEE